MTLDAFLQFEQTSATPFRDRNSIAGDLRGALQGVIGGVAALHEVEEMPEATRAQFERIAASAQTLASLVGGLLAEEPAPDPRGGVEIAGVLLGLTRRWSGEALERGRRLCVEADPAAPELLRVDPLPLTRALGNLLRNAIQHAGPGDVRLEVQCGADGGVMFVVLDEGGGVPQAVIDRLRHDGPGPACVAGAPRGLGLWLSRNLAAELGGVFNLGNRPGGGAAATLAFPPTLCAPGSRAAAAPARPSLEGVRILLAEDNPTNQMVATQMLRALNADVTLSSDGVEALEKFEATEFDLVIVDIEMPRMSGLDVIRSIRARTDGRAGVPVVALTAYVMRDHRERIAEAGANGLISKPITSVEALGRALRAHVAPLAARVLVAAPVEPPRVGRDAVGPIADLAVFDTLCAAIGAGMMAELLEKVIADLLQARADLTRALAPLAPKPISSAAHILVSVAGAIGATRLQGCARALYAKAHAGEVRDMPDDVRRCIDEIDLAVAFANDRRTEG